MGILKFVFIRDNQRSLILRFTILPTPNEKEPNNHVILSNDV